MTKPRRFRLPIAFLLGLAVPALAGAQRPLGPPFQVNVAAAASVELSSLAMNARGDFVATWVRLPLHAGEARMLLARRFAADGTPATGEIAVVDDPAPGADNSRVLVSDDGSFAVVFTVYPDLVARRYAPDGAFEGESVVARQTSGRDYEVAARPDGGFVLTWERQNVMFFRLFSPNGEPAGPERRVAMGGPPAVAAGPDGGFVVAWIGQHPLPDPRYADLLVLAQRFSADGKLVGKQIVVQDRFSGVINHVQVAKDEDGGFLVLWQVTVGAVRGGEGVYARRFAADGTPLTGLLKLEGAAAQAPQLAMDRAGNFVVLWYQFGVGPNGQTGAFAQRFTAGGGPFRPAFRVDTAGSESLLASDAGGNFVVVWTEAGKILAQRYRKR